VPTAISSTTRPFITGPGTLTVSTGPATDYAGWEPFHSLTGGQTGDDDHDGVPNIDEYAFGRDPKDGASAQPIISLPTPSSGTLTYTRRRPALTSLAFTVWTSDDLTDWTKDAGAAQTVVSTDGDIETVQVTLSSYMLSNSKLFVRISAR
jgi:hypothetical protein